MHATCLTHLILHELITQVIMYTIKKKIQQLDADTSSIRRQRDTGLTSVSNIGLLFEEHQLMILVVYILVIDTVIYFSNNPYSWSKTYINIILYYINITLHYIISYYTTLPYIILYRIILHVFVWPAVSAVVETLQTQLDELFQITVVCVVDECAFWFVCIASCGNHVFATQAAQGLQDNKLIFKETFQFVGLPKDFVIILDVYTLQLQRVTLHHKEQYQIQPVCLHWQTYWQISQYYRIIGSWSDN